MQHKKITLHRILHGIKWRWEHRRWDVLYPICSKMFPVSSNKVCFISWNGAHFNCNPKAIATYAAEHNYDGKLQLIAVVNHPNLYRSQYRGIKFVRTFSLKHIYILATCKMLVANIRMSSFNKRKGQLYIQTWHGTGPKKSEKDSVAVLDKVYIDSAIKDCRQTDLMLSGSIYFSKWIRHSTWYTTGKILEAGTPRYDDFFNQKIYDTLKKRVLEKYHIGEHTKLVMYAPTFRSLTEIDNYGFDSEILIKTFEEKFGGEWKLLLRFHPNVANFPLPDIFAKHLSRYVINVTQYDDMQDLLCAADILITDFSSVSTEFAVQRKPCFLYAPDYDSYDRGLYLTPDQMPFMFAETEGKLLCNIRTFDESKYTAAVDKYWKLLGIKEKGTACQAVFNEMNKMLWHHTQE